MAGLMVGDIAELYICEEDYVGGQSDNIEKIYKFDLKGTYDSAQKLIDAIGWNVGLFDDRSPEDFKFRNGDLIAEILVNEALEEPSQEEFEAWERGEGKMYSAVLYVPILSYLGQEMSDEEAEDLGFFVS